MQFHLIQYIIVQAESAYKFGHKIFSDLEIQNFAFNSRFEGLFLLKRY